MPSPRIYVADTNVFLRFLTNDVPKQASKVEKRFQDARDEKIALRILSITVIEILFHLEKWYKYPKDKAVEKLEDLFAPIWMQVDDKNIIFEAFRKYVGVNTDFVDVLTFYYAKNSDQKVLTFDKDFKKLDPKSFELP